MIPERKEKKDCLPKLRSTCYRRKSEDERWERDSVNAVPLVPFHGYKPSLFGSQPYLT